MQISHPLQPQSNAEPVTVRSNDAAKRGEATRTPRICPGHSPSVYLALHRLGLAMRLQPHYRHRGHLGSDSEATAPYNGF